MIDKASLPLDRPRRTPDHPTKSHVVKTKVDGREKIIRFGEQGASTAGKPKAGESERMKAKRASFKARHAKNIAKGKSSPAYWADKVKWADGGGVSLKPPSPSRFLGELMDKIRRGQQSQNAQEFDAVSSALREARTTRKAPLSVIKSEKTGEPIIPPEADKPVTPAAPTTVAMATPVAPPAQTTGETPVAPVAPTGGDTSTATPVFPAHVLKSPHYADTVRLAEKYGIPTEVFVALVNQESRFNPQAVSPKGAYGLAQLMPGTSKMLGVDPKDPIQNLEGGARFFRQMMDKFGSLPLALAAYNAGPGNVNKYKGIPPFAETQDYVKKVLRSAGVQGYEEGGEVEAPKVAGALGTVRAALIELGNDPEKYDNLRGLLLKRMPEDVYKSLSLNERNALGLLQASESYGSGVKSDEFLSRLSPYLDLKIDMNDPAQKAKVAQWSAGRQIQGYVDIANAPDVAVTLPSDPIYGLPAGDVLTHELEHVLQAKDTGTFPMQVRNRLGNRFLRGPEAEFVGRAQHLYGESAPDSTLRQETLPARNVFDNPNETKANVASAAQRAAVRGGDFLQTPEGQALFPTPESRAYYYGAVLPGVTSAYPSQGTFIPADTTPRRDKSYARQLVDLLSRYAEGGEVRQYDPDEVENVIKRFNEGGAVKGYDRGGEAEMKPTPQNPLLGKLAGGVKSVQELASRYSIPEVIPFLGGMGVDELLGLPGAARETERWSYGNYPLRVNPYAGRTSSFVPEMKPGRQSDVADTVLLGMDVVPLAGLAGKYGLRAGKAGVREVGEQLNRAVLDGGGVLSPLVSESVKPAYVVKPKGGNWLQSSIDEYIVNPLKVGEELTPAQRAMEARLTQEQRAAIGEITGDSRNSAINKWLDTKLRKYVQNEMGTPDDPIRKLADEGKLHINPELLPYTVPDELTDVNPKGYVGDRRTSAGFPAESASKTVAGRNWEASTDMAITRNRAGELVYRANDPTAHSSVKNVVENNPWLRQIDQGSPVYGAGIGSTDLGFAHIVDELKNATRPDTDLPARLRIDPAKLEKMTVPQIVERVSQINAWRAEQAVEANAARAMNPATQVVKEYPDQGYKWVELRQPENVELSDDVLRKAMQERGMTQDEIEFALRDPEMRALVTEQAYDDVGPLADALKYEGETMGHCVGGYCPDVIEGRSRIYSLRDSKGEPHVTIEVKPGERIFDTGKPEGRPGPEEIVQIKGKANRAPKEDYLPFVQDFVKGGQWSKVGDLGNTRLVDLERRGVPVEMRGGQRFVTEDEYKDIVRKNAEGYAAGGLVSAYNPEAIDAMVNQILEGEYV